MLLGGTGAGGGGGVHVRGGGCCVGTGRVMGPGFRAVGRGGLGWGGVQARWAAGQGFEGPQVVLSPRHRGDAITAASCSVLAPRHPLDRILPGCGGLCSQVGRQRSSAFIPGSRRKDGGSGTRLSREAGRPWTVARAKWQRGLRPDPYHLGKTEGVVSSWDLPSLRGGRVLRARHATASPPRHWGWGVWPIPVFLPFQFRPERAAGVFHR